MRNSALAITLVDRGRLRSGSLSDTNIQPGVYHIGNASDYSDGPSGMPSWCIFIQFRSIKCQMIISTIDIYTRARLGSPEEWTEWGHNK